MSRHLRPLRVAALLLLTALASAMLVAPGAAAADGKHYDCYRADYGCVAGTGYAGQASWGYPGPHNCTLYAAYRLSRNGYGNPSGLGNAYEWDERARARGVVVDQNPAVGAIAQRDISPGHVMYVDEVHADHIVITEDNWGGGTGRARIHRGTPYWNTLEFIHFRDIRGSYPDGTFIVDADTGEVFRIAGGAPLYVSTWSAFGAPQPVTAVSHAGVLALPQHPADGTFVVGTARGEVYRFAGGAPLYVSTWNAFGGPQPLVAVDQAALDNAGAGSAWNHARFYPADHTLLTTNQDGRVWQVLDHVAVYVRSWDEVGGPRPTTGIDVAAVLNAGQPGAYSHLSGYIP